MAQDTRPCQPGTTSRWSWYRGLGSPSRVLAPMVDQSEPAFRELWCSLVKKVHSGQCPNLDPAPPQGAPGGSGRFDTPRERLGHWTPGQCLVLELVTCSS